jgi:hypothetical protein
MDKALTLILAGTLVGAISGVIIGGLFAFWEKRKPLLGKDAGVFNEYFIRVSVCAWPICGLLYILLTYWWPK